MKGSYEDQRERACLISAGHSKHSCTTGCTVAMLLSGLIRSTDHL